MSNKKLIGAVLGAFALTAMTPAISRAGEEDAKPAKAEKTKKAKKGDKKDKKKDADAKKGGDKSCGADGKGCGGGKM